MNFPLGLPSACCSFDAVDKPGWIGGFGGAADVVEDVMKLGVGFGAADTVGGANLTSFFTGTSLLPE